MKPGDTVWVERGGHPASVMEMGSTRKVPAILVRIEGTFNCVCRLSRDDPLATVYPFRKGQMGWWNRSSLSPRPSRRKAPWHVV